MIRIFIFLTVLLFPSISLADKWDKTDTSLQVAYSLVHLADWSQTIKIAEYANKYKACEKDDFGHWRDSTDCGSYQKEITESNIYLGKRPSKAKVNKYFAGSLIGHYLVSVLLSKRYRNIWQSAWIGIEVGYVNHNIKNGFKVSINI